MGCGIEDVLLEHFVSKCRMFPFYTSSEFTRREISHNSCMRTFEIGKNFAFSLLGSVNANFSLVPGGSFWGIPRGNSEPGSVTELGDTKIAFQGSQCSKQKWNNTREETAAERASGVGRGAFLYLQEYWFMIKWGYNSMILEKEPLVKRWAACKVLEIALSSCPKRHHNLWGSGGVRKKV